MKKLVMLAVSSILALSAVSCQSTAEKVCNKNYDCMVGVCNDDACKKAAETALDVCIDLTNKELEAANGGKLEEVYDCAADNAECKDGNLNIEAQMTGCLLKVADK